MPSIEQTERLIVANERGRSAKSHRRTCRHQVNLEDIDRDIGRLTDVTEGT